MKVFSSIVVLGLACAAVAQSACESAVAAIPSCAQSCIVVAASAVGCGTNDLVCQCNPASNSAIAASAQACVISGCGIETALAAQSSGAAVCSCVATAAPASATTSPASSSSAAPSSASAAPSSTAPVSTNAVTSPSTSAATSAETSKASGSAASGGSSTPTTSGPAAVTSSGAESKKVAFGIEAAVLAVFGGAMAVL